ncbi:MAG TPA: hypothetical protein VNL15_01805 [Dehalococcoidia bacterium]|nr:hypothetical protein [Dehalococcoidia bacterium]
MLYLARFSILDGEVRDEARWADFFPHSSKQDLEPSDLCVLVEPALPGSEEFCDQLVEAIGQLYHQRKLSLSGGLLRAFQAANLQLREWNRKSFKEHRIAAGVSALALTDNMAYLAQVGPALAFARQQSAQTARPEVQRLEPNIPEAMQPLGLDDEFWPSFFALPFQQGSSLLLLTSELGSLLDDQEVNEIMSQPPDTVLTLLQPRVRQIDGCSAVLIARTDDLEDLDEDTGD